MFASRGFLNRPAAKAATGPSSNADTATEASSSIEPAAGQRNGKEPFAILKPLCFQVLNLAKRPASSQLSKALEDLRKALSEITQPPKDGTSRREPLSPALINYIFYPLAEILRTSLEASVTRVGTVPSSKLSDVAEERLFWCLELLCNDWWHAWSAPSASSSQSWPVFEQLLLLGTIKLSKATSGWKPSFQDAKGKQKAQRSSQETVHAILAFLFAVLRPRSKEKEKQAAVGGARTEAQASSWEWDGESELPDLDTFEEERELDDANHGAIKTDELTAMQDLLKIPLRDQTFPKDEHRRAIIGQEKFRNTLAQLLGICGQVASDPSASREVRLTSTKVMSASAITWLSGSSTICVSDEAIIDSLLQEDMRGSDLGIFRHIVGKERSQASRKALLPVLPGLVSSLSRILLSRTKVPDSAESASASAASAPIAGPVASSALDVLRQALAISLNDEAMSDLDLRGASTDPSAKECKQTFANVRMVLQSLSPLCQHDSLQVKTSMANLAFELMHECLSAISLSLVPPDKTDGREDDSLEAPQLLVRWLLDLCASNESQVLSDRAKNSLRRLSGVPTRPSRSVAASAVSLLISDLFAVATGIRALKDDDIIRTSHRIGSNMALAPWLIVKDTDSNSRLATFFTSNESAFAWTSKLTGSIKLDLSVSVEDGDSQNAARIRGLSQQASRAVTDALHSIGAGLADLALTKGAEITPEPLILHLLKDAERFYDDRNVEALERASSVLLVAERILGGLASRINHSQLATLRPAMRKRISKSSGRLAKEAALVVKQMLELISNVGSTYEDLVATDETEQAVLPAATAKDGVETSSAIVRKGLPEQQLETSSADIRSYAETSPLDLRFAEAVVMTPQTNSGDSARVQEERRTGLIKWTQMLCNTVLSHISSVQGQGFQGAMRHVLYPVVRGLASPDNDVRQSSLDAINVMSRSIGYASVQQFVWDNADYILGQAVHLLREGISQVGPAPDEQRELLASQAGPLVMVQVMQLLGPESVVLLQDAVDELLDALDRFHGYAFYTSSLLSVLTGVIRVVSSEAGALSEEHVIKPRPRRSRADMLKSLDVLLHPQNAPKEEETDAPAPAATDEEEVVDQKKERMDQVVSEVMERAIPFLSHPSPFLRQQSLQLLAQGSLGLASRGSFAKLMPLVNSSFPIVLNRLGASGGSHSETDLAVTIESLALLRTWSRTTPDFLTRRLNDEAWPRLHRLLNSLLPERGAGTNNSAIIIGGHGDRGRRRELLLGLMDLCRELVLGSAHRLSPDASWTLCTHPVLLTGLVSTDPDVKNPAIALFVALRKHHSGSVWASLNSAAGKLPHKHCVPHSVRVSQDLPFAEIFQVYAT